MPVSDKVYVIHYKQIAHKSQIAKAQQEIVSVSLFLTQSTKPTEKSTTLTQKTFQTSYQQYTLQFFKYSLVKHSSDVTSNFQRNCVVYY